MTIYGRFHSPEFENVVVVKRVATLDDVKEFEGRRPDKTDKKAIELGSYVVVEEQDGCNAGTPRAMRLYHVAYLKADNGWSEISNVIEATKASADRVAEQTRHDVAASVARHEALKAPPVQAERARVKRGQVRPSR
jgi:hypothetical protein